MQSDAAINELLYMKWNINHPIGGAVIEGGCPPTSSRVMKSGWATHLVTIKISFRFFYARNKIKSEKNNEHKIIMPFKWYWNHRNPILTQCEEKFAKTSIYSFLLMLRQCSFFVSPVPPRNRSQTVELLDDAWGWDTQQKKKIACKR